MKKNTGDRSQRSKVRGQPPAEPQRFHGQTYAYHAGALSGVREIGVTSFPAMRGYWTISWYDKDGFLGHPGSLLFAPSKDPNELQAMLDDYAEQNGLKISGISKGVSNE